MKTFEKPFLEVVEIDVKDMINTACVIECSCDLVECLGNCNIVVIDSK